MSARTLARDEAELSLQLLLQALRTISDRELVARRLTLIGQLERVEVFLDGVPAG